eukprot:COSAG02_NODE_854_length_16499_cov_76.082561_3_plen_196_part_00
MACSAHPNQAALVHAFPTLHVERARQVSVTFQAWVDRCRWRRWRGWHECETQQTAIQCSDSGAKGPREVSEFRPGVNIADAGMRATRVRAAREWAEVQHGGHFDCHPLAEVCFVDERDCEASISQWLDTVPTKQSKSMWAECHQASESNLKRKRKQQCMDSETESLAACQCSISEHVVLQIGAKRVCRVTVDQRR